MTIKTHIKAGPGNGGILFNHNQTQVQADLRSAERTRGLKVKSGVKAGPAGHYTQMAWAKTR